MNTRHHFLHRPARALVALLVTAGLAACGVVPTGSGSHVTYTRIRNQPHNVYDAHAKVVGGKLYSFGGYDTTVSGGRPTTPTGRSFVYDPASDTWTPIASLPGGGLTHAGIATDGTNIFIVGGYPKDAAGTGEVHGTTKAWKYTPPTNRYDSLPDLPAARGSGQLEYLNGQLHYFGGTDVNWRDVTNHYVLDVKGGATAWREAAPLPQPRNHFGSAVVNGRIYAIGGQIGQEEGEVTQRDVYAYDPSTNAWTPRAPLPAARSHIAGSTFVLGGRIIVAGGEYAWGNHASEVSAYDPVTNTWMAWPHLPAKRPSGSADALGNGFIFTGGYNTSEGWRATVK